MKKTLLLSALFIGILFTISSCSKNGAQGPAGPLSTGTLTGFVTTYDQYGFKLLTNLANVTVHISDGTNDSALTTATGAYTFNNMKTGVYTLTYSAPGFGTVVANDYSFLGGGTIVRNQSISVIPSFSLFNATIIDTTIATDNGVVIRGTDTVNGVARTYIVFGGSSSTVSSAPGNYVYANTGTIKAGSAGWGLFMTSQELHDAGLTAGSTGYFVVYPISTGSPTYLDLATGKTVYTALGSPTAAFSITLP